MSSRQRLEDRFGELYIKEERPQQSAFKNGLPTFKPVVYRNPEDSDSGDEYPLPPPPPGLSSHIQQPDASYYQHSQPAYSDSQNMQHSSSEDFFPAPTPVYASYNKGSSGVSNSTSVKYSGPVSTGYPAYSQPSGYQSPNYVHTRDPSHSSQLSAEIDHLYEAIKARPNPQPAAATSHSMSGQTFTPYKGASQMQSNPHGYSGYDPQGAAPARSGFRPETYDNDPGSPKSVQNTYEVMQKDAKFREAGRLVPLPSDQPISKPVKTGKEAEVDALTNLLLQNMESSADPDFFDVVIGKCAACKGPVTGYLEVCAALGELYHMSCFRCHACGICAKCGQSIIGENSGCTALDQVYHIQCFTCVTCDLCLKGTPFFAMDAKPYCEACYMNTLEKCSVCSKPITDRILRATGKPYHPGCFTCVVCGKSLDGIPFTVDATNQIHCIEDFHKKFAPRCCVCGRPIMPEPGREETIRIVALDRSFHVQCYQCEDCGLLLSSEADGRGCYPLDDHILCKNCNAKRIQAMTTKMTTEL